MKALFAHAKEDRPLLAIGLLLIGVFTLGLQDALMKLMSSETSFWQIQTLRSAGNLIILLILASMSGGLSLLLPRNARAVFLRAAFLTACMFFFFSGAPFLTLAQMGAGLYTYPLFVSLLAKPVLGESVGIWRSSSIILGAIGAAIVLRPWENEFSFVQMMPILAGFFYACNILTLRKACRHESTLALAFAVALFFITSGIVGITFLTLFPLSNELRQSMPYTAIGWPELTMLVAGFAVLASILNLTGNICLTRAYQTADSSLLAPLDFSYLLFAAIWGRIIFGDWPDAQSLMGMALIMAAGGIITWREQQVKSQAAEKVAQAT